MTELPQTRTIKSFWARPEGTVGMIVAVVLAALAVYGVGLILPFLIGLLSNLLTAGLLFLAVAALATILFNKRFWTLFFGLFKLGMRWMTGMFIQIDPIGILKNYLDSLRTKLANIQEQINNLRGQMGQLKVTIDQNRKQYDTALKMAKAAKENGKQAALVLNARSAGRLKESTITLEQLYKKLEGLLRILNKMYEVSEFMFTDIKEQVKVLEVQNKAITSGYRAMKSTMAFIANASDDKALYDETVEYLLNDYGQKLGEIEQFMDVATPFIEGVDLQNMAFEADALRELENWEKKADGLLINDTKQLVAANVELMPLLAELETPARETVPVTSNSKSTYLKK